MPTTISMKKRKKTNSQALHRKLIERLSNLTTPKTGCELTS